MGLFLLGIIAFSTKSYAQDYSVSTSSITIEKGQTATFNINNSELSGRFNISASNGIINLSKSSEWLEFYGTTVTVTGVEAGT